MSLPVSASASLPAFPQSRRSGLTLVEVMTAMAIFSVVIIGVLASLVQGRRAANINVTQGCALTIVQGYMEQIKNLPLQSFVNASATDLMNNPNLGTSFILPTIKDSTNATVQLKTTPSSIAATTLTGATPGTTPTGVVDNLQTFDMDSQATPSTDSWSTIWPGANSTLTPYPTTTPGKTDLRMNFWVQITDLTPTSSPKCKAYGILIVYTWQYLDGQYTRYIQDSVRSIRSAVQTF
ncbi:MAG: prepilin-type N-terminal cleavage/methylation domain-containing protein [Verrucomicrobiota bacterium]